MTVWAGRLFGPGQPAAGTEVEVSMEADTLRLRAAGEYARQVAVTALSVRHTGFNDSQLQLAWQDSAGAWACHLGAAADIAALLAVWPRERAPLPRKLSGARRRRMLPWATLTIIIALPLMVLAAFLMSQDRVVDFIAARISPAVERHIGAATLAQVKTTTRFVEQGPQAQALAAVARQLVAGDASAYRFHLADDELVNAFAVPGGDIVVYRGLLEATRSADELAGVLAHEMQHVALRHSLKSLIRGAGMSMLWAIIVGDAGSTLAGQAADRLLSLKFSRDAEREADAHGFNLLVERGIDPHGMVRFFATLAERDGATPPALLSTHPASAEREAALAARLASLPADCCKPLHDGPWPPRATTGITP